MIISTFWPKWAFMFGGMMLLLSACTRPAATTQTPISTVTLMPVAPAATLGTAGESVQSDAESHFQLGNAYTAKHDYERAVAEYSQAIALAPTYVNAYIYRGSAYENQGQFDLARQDYEAALKIDPNSAGAYFKRAILFFDTGDEERAIADLNKAIELDPELGTGLCESRIALRQTR